jgi:hypothetical protein
MVCSKPAKLLPVLSIAALAIAMPSLAQPNKSDKFTVCTLTINSDNEANLFKKKLAPASRFEFVELLPSQGGSSGESQSGKSGGSENWFEDACSQLKAESKTCDMLVISGHFGGTFFGSSGKRLPLETLERMGCNQACPGIMNSPKEVFLFGCNTLAGKGKDTRTPEQYRAVLRAEVNAQGDRLFSDAQVEEIVAFRYSEFGHSNRERMSRAFSSVPHIYGFDSVAPAGKNAEASVSAYLNAIPDYGKHLEQIELEQATKGMADTLKQIKVMNDTGQLKPNRAIDTAFKCTNFAQCCGTYSEDTANFCTVFDPSKTLASRLSILKGLLSGPEGTKYLQLAKQFFEQNQPDKYDATTKAEFDQISQSPVVRERFQATLKALEKMPGFALDLTDLGEKIAFITKDDANQRRRVILAGLINEGSVEAKDRVCSRQNWPDIPTSSIQSQSLTNSNSLQAISCLNAGVNYAELSSRLPVAALSSKDANVRRLSAWLIGMSGTNQKATTEKLLTANLGDKDQYSKQMAAWALHAIGPESVEAQGALIKSLSQASDDGVVRRDAAMAFFKLRVNGGELSAEAEAALDKAKSDGDSIVKKIAERTLSGHFNSQSAQADLKAEETVVSSTGVKFERIKNPVTGETGWRDTVTKLIWYEPKDRRDQYDSEMDCAEKPGERLPSMADFAVAESHGIRDVIKSMKDRWFWSSSAYSYNAEYARYFNGYNGGVDYYYRYANNFSVACVSGR